MKIFDKLLRKQPKDYNKGWGRIMNMILNEGEYKMKYIKNYEKIKGKIIPNNYIFQKD